MHGSVHSPPADATVHGNVHISSILFKLIVYFFDMVGGYWKIFMTYETKYDSRTFIVKTTLTL